MPNKKYIIDESELLELLEGYSQYIALDNGGVDNWDWYYGSLFDYRESVCKELNLPSKSTFKDIAHHYLKDYKEYCG